MEESKPNTIGKNINRLFIIIGIGILVHVIFLVSTIDKASFAQLLKIKFFYLLAISILALLTWFAHSSRVKIWTKFLDHPVTWREAFHVVLANEIGSAIAPSAVGGGPVKIGMLVNYRVPTSKATFMILLSACEDVIFYICGILVTFIYMRQQVYKMGDFLTQNKLLFYGTIILIAFSYLFKQTTKSIFRRMLTYLPPKLSDSFTRLRQKLSSSMNDIRAAFGKVMREGKREFALSVSLLFVQWFSKFTILGIILHTFEIDFAMIDVYIKQWILIVTLLFIPTPGSSGGAEAGFLMLFNQNIDSNIINLVVSTWRFFSYYFILILAAIFFNLMTKKQK